MNFTFNNIKYAYNFLISTMKVHRPTGMTKLYTQSVSLIELKKFIYN